MVAILEEGTVRVFKFEEDGGLALQYAWRALENQTISLGKSRMHVDWSPSFHWCVAGGNARQMCLWDVNTEQCAQRLPTTSRSFVTSIQFGKPINYSSRSGKERTPTTIFAGFGDGCLAMYDTRLKPIES